MAPQSYFFLPKKKGNRIRHQLRVWGDLKLLFLPCTLSVDPFWCQHGKMQR